MAETTIEWTDATWNPVTGCRKVSAGCTHCYAQGVAERFWGTQYPPQRLPDGSERPRRFTDVRCHPERLDQPLRWRKPRRVFVNSMSDLFHEDVPDEFIDEVWRTMAMASAHTFQILTKRPERMLRWASGHRIEPDVNGIPSWYECAWVKWPLPNVWLGVSVEDQATAEERIPLLLQTSAAVRFLSCEPLLGPVNLRHVDCGDRDGFYFVDALTGRNTDMGRPCADVPALDWVIVGGESGPGARPMHPAWARSLVEQCRAAGVACFVKQLGAWRQCSIHNVRATDRRTVALHLGGMTAMRPDNPFNPWERGHPDWIGMLRVGGHQGDPDEWPGDLRVREWPRTEVPA